MPLPNSVISDSIKNRPSEERPRERCLKHGPASLSLRECLALILGSGPRGMGCLGLAGRLLERVGADLLNSSENETAFFHAMESSGFGLLQDCMGIGPAARTRILASFELGRRYALFRQRGSDFIKSTQKQKSDAPQVSQIALSRITPHLRNEPQEWLGFIPIYPAKRVGQFCLVEKGVRTHVNVDPADLFSRILVLRPTGLILAHNHPSGNLRPSKPDLYLTHQVSEMAAKFGIYLLGHWIVGSADQFWIPEDTSHLESD